MLLEVGLEGVRGRARRVGHEGSEQRVDARLRAEGLAPQLVRVDVHVLLRSAHPLLEGVGRHAQQAGEHVRVLREEQARRGALVAELRLLRRAVVEEACGDSHGGLGGAAAGCTVAAGPDMGCTAAGAAAVTAGPSDMGCAAVGSAGCAVAA